MDFPGQNAVTPLHINSYSSYMVGTALRVLTQTSPGSFTWPTGSLAVYVPLTLPWPYNVRRAFWWNGSVVGGNADIGIYTLGGERLWSAGSTVTAGASNVQYVTVSPDRWLQPGHYYLAVTFSGTTNVCYGSGPAAILLQMSGMRQQASALPLPSPATFAAMATAAMPVCGITRTGSGF